MRFLTLLSHSFTFTFYFYALFAFIRIRLDVRPKANPEQLKDLERESESAFCFYSLFSKIELYPSVSGGGKELRPSSINTSKDAGSSS